MPPHGNYVTAIDLSAKNQERADMGLSAVLMLSPLWAMTIGDINQVLAMVGGIIGISIGSIRLWRLLFTRRKDKSLED